MKEQLIELINNMRKEADTYSRLINDYEQHPLIDAYMNGNKDRLLLDISLLEKLVWAMACNGCGFVLVF